MKLSIIVPVHNEKENIRPLLQKVRDSLPEHDFELIFVDDGSTDGTPDVLREVAKGNIKVIFLQKNFGQTAAISAGVDVATGTVIIPMDGDLENDPADIPKLIAKMNEGFDVVSGWRFERWKNEFVTRKIPSKFANYLTSAVSGLKLHDYGCTLKAYRAEILKDIRLYGDMHRFIAAYAHWNGAKVTEIAVSFHQRTYGQSHYGFGRIWRVLLDLLTLKFLSGYATRPIHLFGSVGIISIILGFIAGALTIYFKFSTNHQKDFIQTPLPVIMAMLVVVGVMLIMMGLLAEILMRTYHESQKKTTYTIKEKINI